MLPSYNQGNQSYAHTKTACNIGLLDAVIGHFPYFYDVAIGKFWFGASVEAKPGSVSPVIRIANPFKIGNKVVHLVSVNMVNLFKVGGVLYERLSYKSVDQKTFDVGAHAKTNAKVLFSSFATVDAGPDNLPQSPQASSILVDDDTIDASDLTVGADFVESFESEDRAPFFNHHLIPPANVKHDIKSCVTKTQGV